MKKAAAYATAFLERLVFFFLFFFIKFCFDYPHFCTSNIRYVMLLIPVASITIGLDEKGTRWRAGVAFVYCLLSAAQFILLGL